MFGVLSRFALSLNKNCYQLNKRTMINPDRATLDFLNSFSEESQKTGEHWHNEGCVTQIFGNYLLIRGTLETPEGLNIETSLTMRGNGWVGESDSDQGRDCPGLYATMLERLDRGRNLPESPNEIGDTPLPILLEESLGRELDDDEETSIIRVKRLVSLSTYPNVKKIIKTVHKIRKNSK